MNNKSVQQNHLVIEPVPAVFSQGWAIDWTLNSLPNGTRCMTIFVGDNCTKRCLAIVRKEELGSGELIQCLDRLKLKFGLPSELHIDNDRKRFDRKFVAWANSENVRLIHRDNMSRRYTGYLERIISKFEKEILSCPGTDLVNINEISQKSLEIQNRLMTC